MFSGDVRAQLCLWPCSLSLGDQLRQSAQVMRRASEDEQPVQPRAARQFHLADRPGLFQTAEVFLHQPAAAQVDGVVGVPGGCAVEVRATLVDVLRDMHGAVELARGLNEILRVEGLVRAQSDALPSSLGLLFEHQQRGLALGIAVGRSGHRRSDQAVAVLHQRVAQIGQMRLDRHLR